MRELQKRQSIKRILYSVPSIIILSIVTIFFAKGAFGVIGKGLESAERAKDLEAKASTLALREQELKEDIARLETEEGLKEEIKDKFSVTQEGELVAVIVDEKRASSSDEFGDLPWYKRFWLAIIGNK